VGAFKALIKKKVPVIRALLARVRVRIRLARSVAVVASRLRPIKNYINTAFVPLYVIFVLVYMSMYTISYWVLKSRNCNQSIS